MTETAINFQKELKQLIIKYQPEVEINYGYYGDIYGINFYVDGFVCANKENNYQNWDFGDGLKDIKELK